MSMTSSKSGSFRTAVRDALRSGLSCDRALAAGLGSTMDDTAHTEGARAIISTVLSGVRAGIASEHGQSVSSSKAKPLSVTKTGPTPPANTAAKPQTGGLKPGVAPTLKGGVKRPGTAKAPTSPASPTPVAVAKTPSTATKPASSPPPAPVPKAPGKPTTPRSATGPKTQPIKPRKAPMAIKATVRKPPGIRPPAKYTPDAKRAFKQAFRDAVRENQPLSRVIELGVISGTQHNNMTPESAGTEYKSPVTKDAFRKRFADALAKGVSTTDALNVALATDEIKRDEGGKFAPSGSNPAEKMHSTLSHHGYKHSLTAGQVKHYTKGLNGSNQVRVVGNNWKHHPEYNKPAVNGGVGWGSLHKHLGSTTTGDETIPAKPRPTNAIVKHPPPPSIHQRQTNMQARRDLRPAHVVARAYGPGVTRDAPQGYYGTVRNKGGNVTHSTGPHPSHEVAKAEAFKVAPKARTVETSRGEHGMDIRYHSR